MNTKFLLTLIVFLAFSCNASWAHKSSDSYIVLKKSDSGPSLIEGRFDIALRDLEYAIGIDDNYDGLITWKEVKSHHKDIAEHALSSFKLKAWDSYCTNKAFEHLIDNHSDGAYSVIKFNIECPGRETRPTAFDIDYSLFFDINPQHRGLLNIQHKDKTLTAIFSPENSRQHIDLNSSNLFFQFIEFIKEGIWHIWIGFDHILFLLSLLLPSVLTRNKREWQAVPSFKPAFWNVFKIVTAFTIAHSITLSVAALEIIVLPSRFVESAIALSVLLAALNNSFSFFKLRYWIIAFIFGLIHGFGFASVLLDLGLPAGALLLALVGFNLGVEVGQLVIVSAFLPFAYYLKNTVAYKKIIFGFGSLTIAIIALLWFVERAFNMEFMPF